MAKTKMTAQDYNDNKQAEIVTKILALMEQGRLPWRKPWVGIPYLNPLTKAIYQGRNPYHLSIDVCWFEYSTPLFMGASQAKQWGWFPKKGSKATFIKQGSSAPKDGEANEGETKSDNPRRFFTKWVPVFNLDVLVEGKDPVHTVESIKARYQPLPTDQLAMLPQAEAFARSQQAKTHFAGDVACYCSGTDRISMPPRESFIDIVNFYSTWLHEHAHSTGHPSRLNRPLGNGFGSKAYAYEELIAELASVMVCDRLGISPDMPNHVSYMQGWHSALSDDKSLFFKAAAQAQEACNFMFDQYVKTGNTLPEPSVNVPVEVC